MNYRSLLTFRLFCAFAISTAFAPDEFWQGPEVAHRLVFGYGHLTWEWVAGLRSFVHPLIYALFYSILSILGIDTRFLVFKGPQLIHAILAAWTDLCVYKLTRAYFQNERLARLALLCQVTSWFNAYCLLRTYSSSVEACLTAHALCSIACAVDFKHNNREKSAIQYAEWKDVGWILCAACCVILRPASALFWAVVAAYVVSCRRGARISLIVRGICLGLLVLVFSVCIDRVLYDRWELVPWNFFRFNLLENKSIMYGENPWHANFSTHMPSMLLSYTPYFVYGSMLSRNRHHLIVLAVIYMAIYSLPAHKEIRFLLPALQMCIPTTAVGLDAFLSSSRFSARKFVVYLSVGTQIIAFLYFALFHQRAQIDVMSTIRRIYDTEVTNLRVLFLTPCHATPYYSSIHAPITMRFFDCSPREYREQVHLLNAGERKWIPVQHAITLSEREYFESNPRQVLSEIIHDSQDLPHLIISFRSTSMEIAPVANNNSYSMSQTLHNCFVSFEDNTDCLLDVWTLKRTNMPPKIH